MSVFACIASNNGSPLKKPKTPMNFEELENTWTRQLVVGQPISAEMVQHALVREVRQRSRRVRRIVGIAAFILVIGWATALVTHYTGIKPFTAPNMVYLLAVTCFDLAFFFLAFRSLQRNRREEARMGQSVLEAVRGSVRAVEWQRRDCRRLMYGASCALLGSLAFALWKYAADEFPARGLFVTIIVNVAFALGLAATVRRYYQRNLNPRRQELRQQLDQLER
jgi:hypothetical protein